MRKSVFSLFLTLATIFFSILPSIACDHRDTNQQAEIIYKALQSADQYQAASLFHDLAELHASKCVENPEKEKYKLKHSSTCDEMVRVLLMNAYFGE